MSLTLLAGAGHDEFRIVGQDDRLGAVTQAQLVEHPAVKELNSMVYDFNLRMIRAVQAGAVGWLVPEYRLLPATRER